MNKQSRILVFGIAVMFAGLSMWLADEIGLIGDIYTSIDSFGRLLFLAGLLIGATGAFDIQWSRLWRRMLLFWSGAEAKSAPNEESIVP